MMRKDESGKIVLRENWFLKYFWGRNFWRWLIQKQILADKKERADKGNPKYPSNICVLFWGSVWAPFGLILTLIWAPIAFVGLLMVISLFACIGFFFGFVIVFADDYYRGHKELYHRYKKFGKHDEKKIPIAPWEIAAIGLLIWLIVRKSFLFPRWIIGSTYSVLQMPVVWIVVIVIGVVIGLIIGLNAFFRSTAWKVTREFLKAKKEKACPLITIEREERN